MVSDIYNEVYMTRFLYTARISNVDSVMFVNRIREMVSFELGIDVVITDFWRRCLTLIIAGNLRI